MQQNRNHSRNGNFTVNMGAKMKSEQMEAENTVYQKKAFGKQNMSWLTTIFGCTSSPTDLVPICEWFDHH